MGEELDRHELPIQSVIGRDEDCTTTVPIHLSIFGFDEDRRTDLSLIADAREVVKKWYDEDMAYYLDVLRNCGQEIPHLRGYERFKEEWELSAIPKDGFLSLRWREMELEHVIELCPVPVVLYNQFNGDRRFYTPEDLLNGRLVENIGRNVWDPEVVVMTPEKMRKYGVESEFFRIREEEGVAEVVGKALCSDYHNNMARNLLLRAYGVFYHNRLLDLT